MRIRCFMDAIILLSILLVVRIGLVRLYGIGHAVLTSVSVRYRWHLRYVGASVLDGVGIFDRVDDRRRFRDPVTVGFQVVIGLHGLQYYGQGCGQRRKRSQKGRASTMIHISAIHRPGGQGTAKSTRKSRSINHCMHSTHDIPCDSYNEGEVELMAPSRPTDSKPYRQESTCAYLFGRASDRGMQRPLRSVRKLCFFVGCFATVSDSGFAKPLQVRVVALRL